MDGVNINIGMNLSINIVVLNDFIAVPTSPATPFIIESPPTNFLKNKPIALYITISTTCIIINRLFEINAPISELEELASQLGSDVPFFLYNKLSLCTGRGEIINPLDIEFSGVSVLLVKPTFGLSTKEVYQNYSWCGYSKEQNINNLIEAIKNKDVDKVDELIFNDLENVALKLSNELNDSFNKIKSLSYNRHISGSGPTMFILDVKSIDKKNIEELLPDYKIILCNTI